MARRREKMVLGLALIPNHYDLSLCLQLLLFLWTRIAWATGGVAQDWLTKNLQKKEEGVSVLH